MSPKHTPINPPPPPKKKNTNSRFEFNRAANPYYQPGAFSLKLHEVSAYRAPRPAVVLVSSAGAERNAKVGSWLVCVLALFLPTKHHQPTNQTHIHKYITSGTGGQHQTNQPNKQTNNQPTNQPNKQTNKQPIKQSTPTPPTNLPTNPANPPRQPTQVETEADRRAEIPIVQLNPGGILNWKYKAETHLRSAGVPYTILRACGLVPEKAVNGTARRLQAGQGDAIVGTLTRGDLAAAVVGAVRSPYAAYKVGGVRGRLGGGRGGVAWMHGWYHYLSWTNAQLLVWLLMSHLPPPPPPPLKKNTNKPVDADAGGPPRRGGRRAGQADGL